MRPKAVFFIILCVLAISQLFTIRCWENAKAQRLIQQGDCKTQENQRFSASTTKYNTVDLDQQHSIVSQIKSLRLKAVFFIIICVLAISQLFTIRCWKNAKTQGLIQQGYYKTQENQRFSASTTKYNIVALDQQHLILSQIKSLRLKAVFFIIICVFAISQLKKFITEKIFTP
ncbi:hypothetical protein J2787_000380 [Chryseobacterium rhizosphaerae]|uniref:Transmembrane protein n=1 Tax=Chryseobacterium rhizosphaerae TaxID=395937 RepID=A0AAE3Y4V6_9FLAO|nr:hypothetical protein [Chryseobacterium rhizosphaerae]MDR6524977.1 hypothetical protein [Chryseobacterium rhizosphaerae]MDR6525010.1 hypothetical protein [Chryseobacterium rhizosphaerae]